MYNDHCFFVPADGPYIHSYFTLSTTATSPQRQQPLKRLPTANITSQQLPVNQRLTNGVYKTQLFIIKDHET